MQSSQASPEWPTVASAYARQRKSAPPRALVDRGEQVVARLLAGAAGCGADTTVLVVIGVALTLISAGTARCSAGLDGRADDPDIGLRLTRHDAAGGGAHIRAVETEANATDHLSDVLLGQTRVGASGARGGAIDAVFDAAQQRLAIDAGWVWMRRDDLSNSHFGSFLYSAAESRHATAHTLTGMEAAGIEPGFGFLEPI
jgi:hypothetical protein